jgi:hypothetical protein
MALAMSPPPLPLLLPPLQALHRGRQAQVSGSAEAALRGCKDSAVHSAVWCELHACVRHAGGTAVAL